MIRQKKEQLCVELVENHTIASNINKDKIRNLTNEDYETRRSRLIKEYSLMNENNVSE